ncbi:PREDICTED: probable protein phosphatase 2C 67 isoform X1 [Tarenaya hassleriana]|uniref:probable protein phosphatase 2C 67 isoform X1 n=1 Tax=Tarenaya hassleriana TaxID=28532 RepID=UPI00053C0BA1|nr:PREDICTED: probable protein phosphatase 2C 67 isoform X1 [Tarenaya hassleriana]
MVKPCWKIGVGSEGGKSNTGQVDGPTWFKDLGLHAFGEFSMATIQANGVMEDQCQFESGPLSFTDPTFQGTFVGVYDGHGGPEASRFICNKIFPKLKKFASENWEISEQVIRKAFAETEEDFLTMVKKQWLRNPQMASVGSCCLTGVICNGLVYVANVGDSRAVLGRAEKGRRGVRAVQLSVEHNANLESARQELWSIHPDDPNILVMKHWTWRVKGLIQVTRSIGDAYLKRVEFNREPLMSKFRLPEPFTKPILRSDPSVTVHQLNPEDEFLIFGSDGLWEHLSNQEAVDIVHSSPRKVSSMSYPSPVEYQHLTRLAHKISLLIFQLTQGIARRLIKAALKEAAKKREMRYSDLKQIDPGVRRHFHDDITVVVVYLEPGFTRTGPCASHLSIRGGLHVHSTS